MIPRQSAAWKMHFTGRTATTKPGRPGPSRVRRRSREIAAACRPALEAAAVPRGDPRGRSGHAAAIRFVVERDDLPGPELWLVIERGCDQAAYVKYYLSNADRDRPLLEPARAGHNPTWPVEDCFLRGKQELGLDDYEVRGWRGFHHHMTLVMLAMWFLVLQTRRLGGKAEDGS